MRGAFVLFALLTTGCGMLPPPRESRYWDNSGPNVRHKWAYAIVVDCGKDCPGEEVYKIGWPRYLWYHAVEAVTPEEKDALKVVQETARKAEAAREATKKKAASH